MQERQNTRGVLERFVERQHLKLNDLREEARRFGLRSKYLYREDIPESPKPEFHVSRLKHETTRDGLLGIREEEGFKTGSASGSSLVWWSLAVGPEELESSETRLLEEAFPDRTMEEVAEQQSFLWKFTTSPAFLETSRLGSYRFTFPVEEVLTAYSQQFCRGAQPVMRIYETVLYRQEVMHVVLVHSPDNQDFSDYPELTDDPNAICVYRDGCFIWRPEAMSETHRYRLICRPDARQMKAEGVPYTPYYVWDHVALAFHVGTGPEQVLKFDVNHLRDNLTFCNKGDVYYPNNNQPPDSFHEAKSLVQSLWSERRDPLKVEVSLRESLTVTDLKVVLVGRPGVGKSSSGNIILGRNTFGTGGAAVSPPSGVTQCSQKVFSWNVTIIDSPGFSEPSGPALRNQIFKDINMSAPAPHVVLLVIRLGTSDTEVKEIQRQTEEIFGVNIWRRTVLLLTHVDQTEQVIQEAGAQMKKVCDRQQVFNISPDCCHQQQQVWDLLYEVMKMLVEI